MPSGLLWFNSPDEFIQKFSAAQGEIEGNTEDIARRAAKKGEDRVREMVMNGGENKTAKGGARVLSGRMVDSVGSEVHINGRNRVQGKYGFINGPEWTKWQDRGTQTIPAMMAMANAQQVVYDELSSEFESGAWLPKDWRA